MTKKRKRGFFKPVLIFGMLLTATDSLMCSAYATNANTTGGLVINGRLNGVLAVSRSFGDITHKGNGVIDCDRNVGIALSTHCLFLPLVHFL